jgi:CubicO group peptidase (beta-lactamase class C family)
MRRSATVLGLLAAACAPASRGAPVPLPIEDPPPAHALSAAEAELVARIESGLLPVVRVHGREVAPVTIEQRLSQLGVPAVSVAVVRDGRIAWARAYGVADVASGTPATPETLFQAASMSKPVAAMGTLALVERGLLTLDEDVNRWLTRWRVPAHEWQAESPVTLRGLLSHSAGLTVHGFPGYAPGAEVPTVEQVLAGSPPANTRPVVVSSRPGSEWRYSGGGTTVAQLLVEEVAGVPFAEFMEATVLAPLGMTSSTYGQPLPGALTARAATGYRTGGDAVVGRFHTYPEMAAAGLWTTPTDLARWIVAVQRALGGAPGVISPEMARAMVARQVGMHGLGPQLEGEGAELRFLHGGANEGFQGVFAGYAGRGDGVVVMTNSDAGGALASELVLAIGSAYGWPGIAPLEIVPVPVAAETLRAYEGRYGVAGGLQLGVEAQEGSLVIITPDGARFEFVPVGPGRFQSASQGMEAAFERGEDGAVASLRVSGQRLPRQ